MSLPVARLMVEDVNRASVIIGRIHSLLKKEPPRMEKLDINGAILEVISLIHSEVVKNGVTVRTELAESLPSILGDRVQLQQVILNISIMPFRLWAISLGAIANFMSAPS